MLTGRIRLQKLYKEENFKLEIKPMIENLQDELYQLENKQAKWAKLRANIRSWWVKNAFFKVLQRQNMQNETIFELYTDDNKLKYSSNPKDILKFEKKIMKNPSKLLQLLLLNLIRKFLTERKYLMNTLILVTLKYL